MRENEFMDFTNFLLDLFTIFDYKVGGIVIEGDVLELFDCSETYPNECYRYENFSSDHFLNEPACFINILWNEKYKKLNTVPFNYKRHNKSGLLIMSGSFNT